MKINAYPKMKCMKKSLRFLMIIFICWFVASCQKPFNEPVVVTPPVTYDTDALHFLDSASISDTVARNAVNDFIKALKDSSLWSKFIAIYPMVGGSATSAMYNLKDPRNSDAAFRLTFYGSPLFSQTGVLFPTNNEYADTHFSDNLFTYNNNAISYYSLTQNLVDGYDMGCSDNVAPYNEFAIYNSGDASNWFGYYKYGWAPPKTVGLFIMSSTANDVKRYENGIPTDSKGSAPSAGSTDFNVLIGYVNGADSGGHRECGLATIGQGLSDSDVLTFYNIVQNFEGSLGR
jgi:hypothetical protein